ncbi:hypothetical protein MKW98_028276 [Papaver atlanticum]|uniref:Nucleotide-diphospho-sugar transferase domain-containing protein n=1 Tax=Papaver atlanticum TaxID=357466 RepID=A0AAD4XMN5_9MAGN|nr:hypothetical protein MKW98_028276 [Papaver atlanticum]
MATRRRTSTSENNKNTKLTLLPDPVSGFRRILMLIMLVAAVALPCLALYNAVYPLRLFHSSPQNSLAAANPSLDTEEVKLERVLKAASMKDKTVIITTLNEAWAAPNSIFDLFLESFKIGENTKGLLKHLVVIALDQKAYKRCLEVHPHCYALTVEGVDFSVEAYFMSKPYLKMMWSRIDILRVVLELGYNFLFTDADIMWFRDPFKRFYEDTDFQIATDNYALNDSYNLNNMPNGGFTYVKSNSRSIEFYKFWFTSRIKYKNKHDQSVLMLIKHDPFLTKIGLKIRFLNTMYFGGFCETSKDFNQVSTMHANCCFGLDTKIHDINIMLDDWRNYASSSPSLKSSWNSTWRVPQNCSIKNFDRDYKPKRLVQVEKKD